MAINTIVVLAAGDCCERLGEVRVAPGARRRLEAVDDLIKAPRSVSKEGGER